MVDAVASILTNEEKEERKRKKGKAWGFKLKPHQKKKAPTLSRSIWNNVSTFGPMLRSSPSTHSHIQRCDISLTIVSEQGQQCTALLPLAKRPRRHRRE